MIVSLNPGAPQEREKELISRERLGPGCCAGSDAAHRAHAEAVLGNCTVSYRDPPPGRDYIFHRRSVALARAALRALARDDDDWFELTWFTDLYKCSTPDESSPKIRGGAIAACRPWLDDELLLFEPTVVLALGTVVQKELCGGADGIPADPRIVPFPHPSPANSGTWQKLPVHIDQFGLIRRAAGMPPMSAPERAELRSFLESLDE